jgi:hypothetical protein
MNQQRLRAYINLIQQLLTCPSGEEWILLRQHETLVTPELVQVMEQVATQLASQGNVKEAKFLHNLAGQIHHLFVAQTVPPAGEDEQSQAYIELIKALLECPQGEEGELLAAHQDLIGPGLVHTMRQVAGQLAAGGDQNAAQYLQFWAGELSKLWLQQHEFQPLTKQKLAGEEPSRASVETPPKATQPTRSPLRPEPQGASPSDVPMPAEPEEEDFWAEPVASPMPSPQMAPTEVPSPSLPSHSIESSEYPETGLSAPATYMEAMNRHLETIAEALTRISASLTPAPPPPTDPLWYMEALERAHAGQWILTSGEIQQLIGVKPSCPRNHNTFQRGSWIFVKAGKLGSQTAWRVEKEEGA